MSAVEDILPPRREGESASPFYDEDVKEITMPQMKKNAEMMPATMSMMIRAVPVPQTKTKESRL
jgi:hypothetical protein